MQLYGAPVWQRRHGSPAHLYMAMSAGSATTLKITITAPGSKRTREEHEADDEDEIDWEDGNDEANQNQSGTMRLCKGNESENPIETFSLKKAAENEDEDSDVDWEDGDTNDVQKRRDQLRPQGATGYACATAPDNHRCLLRRRRYH